MTGDEQLLEGLRPASFAIAYRMLGSVSEAEDVVQEALLRDVFDYPFDEIAQTVGKSEDNVRQLAVRARRHVEERRPRFESSQEQRDELAGRFFAAARDGDLGELEALLAHDVLLTGDGGGKVPALARSLHGRSRVARTLLSWTKLGARIPGASIRPVELNNAPGCLLLDGDGRVIAVWSLEISGGQIQAVRSIVNPEKLTHLGEVADVWSLLPGAQRGTSATTPEPE